MTNQNLTQKVLFETQETKPSKLKGKPSNRVGFKHTEESKHKIRNSLITRRENKKCK